MEERGLPAYAAEFIGTFLLVFFICTILSVEHGLGYTDFAVIGLVHVFALAMLIYTLGGTSGGHFNPAVTTAMAALRKISPLDAVVYILVQLSGGILAALMVKALLLDEGKGANYGATLISHPILQGRVAGGLAAEAIGTFVLMWAIMGTAVNPRGEHGWAGLVIGGTLGLAVMCLGPLTGAGFNPARSIGPALVSGTATDLWVYIVAPVAGALLAAGLYTLIVLQPQEKQAARA